MRIKCFGSFLLSFQLTFSHAQSDSISVFSLQKHTRFLASDSMKGRGNYTYELYQCAQYISQEYQALGLKPYPSFENYFQPFAFKRSIKKLKDTTAVSLAKNALVNVIGVLPGKSKPDEVVIFSAHYDHLGIGNSKKNLIYNGANDNAAGVAAVLVLAESYAAKNNNERTLVFCAFSGEEIGLIGSEAFVDVVDAQQITFR